MNTGKIGELLVQLSLLTFGIESTPPLIDSGTDLIAIKSSSNLESIVCKTIQVKTESNSQRNSWTTPERGKLYHILALVRLGANQNKFDDAKIYLIPKGDLGECYNTYIPPSIRDNLESSYQISEELIARLFAPMLIDLPVSSTQT